MCVPLLHPYHHFHNTVHLVTCVLMQVKDAVCINKLDMFSGPQCLDFTAYGILCTKSVTGCNGRSGGMLCVWKWLLIGQTCQVLVQAEL